MHRDPGAREVVRRLLDAVLDADVAGARRMLRREPPAPIPELDPRQLPEHVCAEELVALLPLSILVLEEPARRSILVAGVERIRRDERRRRSSRGSPTAPASSRARAAYSRARRHRRRWRSRSRAASERVGRGARRRRDDRRSRAPHALCSSAAANPFRKRVRPGEADVDAATAAPAARPPRAALPRADRRRASTLSNSREEDEALGAERAELGLGEQVGRDRAGARPLPGGLLRTGRRERSATPLGGRDPAASAGAPARRARPRRRRRRDRRPARPRRRASRRWRRPAEPWRARGGGRGGPGRRRSPRCGRARPAARRPGRRTAPMPAAGG